MSYGGVDAMKDGGTSRGTFFVIKAFYLYDSRMTGTEKSFYGLGIAPAILEIISKLRFMSPTPIQEQSIPVAIEGKDLMGIAQTGTGKTLAFGIPLIQHVLHGKISGLVIVPTRELALQVDETIRKVGAPLGLKTAVLIGGESIFGQIKDIRRNPQIIVGTPGRIIDHLEQKTISLRNVGVLVLDEADRMLDMGFAPQLKRILPNLPRERQTMLFSATMPEEIVSIAKSYMKLPIRVEIARSGTTVKEVTQELFFVPQEQKPKLLEKILQEYRGSVLVFSRTKYSVKKVSALLRALGHSSAEIHGNRSLGQRKEALEGFKRGKYRILVATDIASRGIDVTNIELVLNYDLPQNPEDYVHRIGRTARAGAGGHAISFARPNQIGDVRTIERLTRKTLPVSKVPNLPPPLPFKFRMERAGGKPFVKHKKPFHSRGYGGTRFEEKRPRSKFFKGRR
ncbi:MAG: DEAD/DEAH box helicase [Candidatus Liptonbacteria bacterium]|nr:DEAD/DEAH box helicase [Candidatus Liptonbacteria bacterium]